VGVKGGDKFASALLAIEMRLKAETVQVGWPEHAYYPDGTSTGYVASIMEYGGTVNMPAHDQTVYRKINAKGTEFLRNGRFVKKSQSNFATTHHVDAYTITIPPRPFFRTMIAKQSSTWGAVLNAALLSTRYDSAKSLTTLGLVIAEQLQQSIIDTNDPPLAASTIAAKGSAKPLIDTDNMLKSVWSGLKE
jgi:hypothetical protein